MKRVIICADGTWNNRDQVDEKTKRRHPTNVTKVARAVRPRARDGKDQVVYYHDGIGTGGAMDRVTGGAFGEGMEENTRNLYRFIVYTYAPNDELYFFGFSRGAFTVRSLAGFMNKVGLIEKDDDYYVPEIYRCYESNKGPGSPEWTKAFHNVRDTRPCGLAFKRPRRWVEIKVMDDRIGSLRGDAKSSRLDPIWIQNLNHLLFGDLMFTVYY